MATLATVTFLQNLDPLFGVFFLPDNMILIFVRPKLKFNVDLLKLKLKLIFPPKYFQILRQKNSKSFYLENIKVRPLSAFHSPFWENLGEGSSSSSSCSCYHVKVKSTPRFRLGWEFDEKGY